MARNYRLRLEGAGIDRWRYDELIAFCRQYPDKREHADALADVKSAWNAGASGGGGENASPVERAAMRREAIVRDCELIEQTALRIDGGKWYAALMLNCCYGQAYGRLAPETLPTSRREAYFAARRAFLVALDAAKN